MELFRMAERFADPLFEKVGKLTVEGWIMWMEFFNMEATPEPEPPTNDMIKYFESKGAHVF